MCQIDRDLSNRLLMITVMTRGERKSLQFGLKGIFSFPTLSNKERKVKSMKFNKNGHFF